MKKRLLAMFLCLCMTLTLLPAAALALEGDPAPGSTKNGYGFSTEVPGNFAELAASGEHPFGDHGTDDIINLLPVKELGVFLTSSSSGSVYNFDVSNSSISMVDKVFSTSSHYFDAKKDFTGTQRTVAKWSGEYAYRYAAGTVIDARGTGRPDCVVYYGPREDVTRLDMEVRDLNSATPSNSQTVKNSISGKYTWMKGASRYNAESFVSIVGGDFDGDGKETFVLYDPDYQKIYLREYQYDTSGSASISSVGSYDLGNDDALATFFINKKDKKHSLNAIQGFDGGSNVERNTAAVHLAAGDLNGDDKDELVVTVSLGNMVSEGTNWEKGSVVMVLNKESSGWKHTWSKQLDNVKVGDEMKNGSREGWHMRAAASTVGDVDGDKRNEIFTVGLASDDNNDDDNFKTGGYIGVITECSVSGSANVRTTNYNIPDISGGDSAQKGYWFKRKNDGSNTHYVGSDTDGLGSMQPVSVGLVRLDGVGTTPYAFIRGQLFQFSIDKFNPVTMNTSQQDELLNGQKVMRQPVVGNFDGNIAGREQIFFVMSTGGDNNVTLGGYYYDPTDGGTEPRDENNKYVGNTALNDNAGLRSCKWKLNGGNVSHAVLTAPDADTNDGMIAQYENAEYLFNAPEVMAILEAVPYFEDLKEEYPETLGSTAFGSSSATGSSSSETSTNRAGAYVGFEQSFTAFGLAELASVEFETAYESEWNDTVTVGTEFETAIDFDAGRESNQVVMMCIPAIVYNYKIWDQGKESTMSITQAQQPSYLTMSVEEYNEIAETIGDPVIDASMIGVVPGQPGTYPGLEADVQGSNFVRYGTAVATTSGSTVTTQSFSENKMKEVSTEHTHNIDVKAGGGVLGLKVGGSYGHGWGSGTSTSSTEGVSRSGSVANIPDGYPDYGFTWEFATWDVTIGSGAKAYQVPVLGYLVSNVRQPPSVPRNLNATPEAREVELSWDHGFNSAAGYEICYYLPNNPSGKTYYPLATVDGSKDTYIDTGLEPRTPYQYVVRSIGADGKVSNYTEPVMVVTASTQGLPTIHTQPENANVQVGKNASFSVIARPAGSRPLDFTWQSRPKNGSVWKTIEDSGTIEGSGERTLTIKNVTAAMDGTQYRCMVSELDASLTSVFVYSRAATLEVGKADSTTTLTLSSDSGTAAYYDEDTSTETIEIPKTATISGVTYSEYANNYAGALKADANVYYGQAVPEKEYAYYLKAGTDTAPERGTKLSALGDWLLDNSGNIVARRHIEQNMERIYDAESAESTYADYKVFTATVFRDSIAAAETLVYQKADGSGSYYLASSTIVGEGVGEQTRLVLGVALTVELGTELTTDNTYLVSTLTPVETEISDVVSDGTDEGGKPTYSIYNAYTLVDDSSIIYEKDGTYFTKTGESAFNPIEDPGYIPTLGLYGTESGNVVSNIVQVGAPEMKTEPQEVTTYTLVQGASVTLTATVNNVSAGSTVTFRFTNTTTCATTSVGPQPLTNKMASLTWTPPTAGVYQIIASYSGGSDTLPSVSAPKIYYAQENPEDGSGYAIELEDTLLYGDAVDPVLNQWTKTGEAISISSVPEGVSFKAHHFANGDYAPSVTNLTNPIPGQYRVDAVLTGNVVASKLLTVEKRPVTITAPTPGPISASGDFDPAEYVSGITYSVPSVKTEYPSLFTLTGPTDVSRGGNYDIQVAYADDKTEFLSGYLPTFTKSVLTVTVGTYAAAYAAGSNGTLTAYDLTANSSPFASGTALTQNHKLLFEATPNNGFVVSSWTVTLDGQSASEGDYRIEGNMLTVTALRAALDVRVTFTNQFHEVSFGVDGNGGVLTAEQSGTALSSPAKVASGSSVTFTATPNEGQVVKEWKVNDTVVKKNGVVFSGATLPLDNISAGTTVLVEFEDTASYAVNYSAVDNNGSPVAGVTITANGLTNGQATKGSAVILTANCTTGIAIQEWQIEQEGGSWQSVAASQSSYTIANLQRSTNVRVVVSVAQQYNLTWNIAMEGGAVPADIATLTATSNGQVINAGQQSAYISVDFALDLNDAYCVVGWSDNVTQNASDPKLASLASLTEETEVTVTIAPVGTQITYAVTGESDKAELSAVFTTSGSTQEMAFASGSIPAANGTLALTVENLAEGYEVDGWYVNGVKVDGETGEDYAYSATKNTGAEITVKIVRSSYTVTFSAENGSISALSGGVINSGDAVVGDTDVTFTAVPKSATGYNFEGWYVNNIKQAVTDPALTLTVTEVTVVKAVYRLIATKYDITYGVVDTNDEVEGGFNGTLNGVTAGAVSVNADSSFSFTAVPTAGYLVEGWYSDSAGRTPVAAAAYEQTDYTVDNVTAPQTVYVKFAPIPTYAITVDVGTNGSVTASVNGQTVEISGGALTVSRHDNVVLTAAPASYHHLEKWMLDSTEQGNALTLILNDVTDIHTVSAVFAASQMIELKTQLGDGGSLATLVDGGPVDASAGIRITTGQSAEITAVPENGKMVKAWTVNGVVQDNLSNVLSLPNLTRNTVAAVTFENLTLHSIPADVSGKYTITNITKTPTAYGVERQIRDRGDVTFTVVPAAGKSITAMTVTGGTAAASRESNGTWTVTVKNVIGNITLTPTISTSIPLTVADTLNGTVTVTREGWALTNGAVISSGDVLTITAAASSGYRLDSLSVNGNTITSGGNYTVLSTDTAVNISATFAQVPGGGGGGGGGTVAPRTLIEEINAADDGDTVETELDADNTILGKDVFKALQGRNVTLQIATGDVLWTVKGTDIPDDTVLKSLNLSTVIGAKNIPDSVVRKLAGDKKNIQLSIAHEGAFGFPATLTLKLGKENAGKYASLYKHLPDGGNLLLRVSSLIGADGLARFVFNSASDYVVVISDINPENPFADLFRDAYYYDAVQWADSIGVTGGTSATTFGPTDGCTRAQVVTFLWRAAGSPMVDYDMPFTDVPAGTYYTEAVRWAVSVGITGGTSATTFSPNNTCTRSQIAAFLYRFADSPAVNDAASFADVPANAYYANAIVWAKEQKVTDGTSATTFSPNDTCTRGQIVTFLYRYFVK